MIVNKTDLLPYVDFDLETFTGYARRLNPDVQILPLSARTGEQLAGLVRMARPELKVHAAPTIH